jgi:hypothetical protein
MAAAIGMRDGNYSAFLNGKRGIGSEATCLPAQVYQHAQSTSGRSII